jgi:hypothetical protein
LEAFRQQGLRHPRPLLGADSSGGFPPDRSIPSYNLADIRLVILSRDWSFSEPLAFGAGAMKVQCWAGLIAGKPGSHIGLHFNCGNWLACDAASTARKNQTAGK